ncbi:11550_t:CDS:2 [Acaulospora colombiana]|uniref:11550_t:CDS:1 n=1 Tax=Acaulospora colombiana TaxID=27376 RepID=A0ACA9NAY7_9GLOM|nr:11550_t:CDS:2 [Acaulospora colombiana]
MSSRRGERARSESPRPRKHNRDDSDREDMHKAKKDKKHKKKSHKRHHSESDSDSIPEPPKGFTPISEDDYYSKSTEFRIWLQEKKDKFFDELSSEQARRYFKKFVNNWNKYRLDKKYYEGMRSLQFASSEKTRYKWKNLKIEQDKLEDVKNTVDRQTNIKFAAEVHERSRGGKSLEQKPQRIIGPSMPSSIPGNYNEDMDQEDRERYERALQKKDRKNFQKTHEVVLEELVPKATARNDYYRREESPDMSLKDEDLLGGDDFTARIASRDRARETRDKKRRDYRAEKEADIQERAVAYRSKEQETIEMFKRMAEERRKTGDGMWSQYKDS